MRSATKISPEGSAFEEFHGRHRDKDGKKLGWMVDFHRAKEGIIYNRKTVLKWRLLELGKQTAWGNKNRDYMADENGNPLTQREIASILGVPYQRVCEAVDELVAEGCLRREGRIILVVDDPAAARSEIEGRTKGKRKSRKAVIYGEERAKFFRFWGERDPEQFQRYQKIGTEIEEKFREQRELSDAAWQVYQEAQTKSGTERTNDSEDPERGGQNVRNGVDESSGTGRIESEPILNGLTSNNEQLASSSGSEPEEFIAQAVQESELKNLTGNQRRAIRTAAARLAGVPPAQRAPVLNRFRDDCNQLATRRENRPKGWGIIVSVMEDAIVAVSQKPQPRSEVQHAREKDPPIAEQVANLEALLAASPEHPQAPEWRERLDSLTLRKPAESEGRAKAQKAGQG